MYTVTWNGRCDAVEFREERTDVSIRGEIHRRKQREGESFDEYFESVVLLSDNLSVPLAEASLLKLIRFNLLPDIQHELLYQDISTISQLRRIIRTRESFLQILRPVVRKPQPAPSSSA